jgi:hypothetical protein
MEHRFVQEQAALRRKIHTYNPRMESAALDQAVASRLRGPYTKRTPVNPWYVYENYGYVRRVPT